MPSRVLYKRPLYLVLALVAIFDTLLNSLRLYHRLFVGDLYQVSSALVILDFGCNGIVAVMLTLITLNLYLKRFS